MGKEIKSVITCDLDGKVETFSEGAERLFGYKFSFGCPALFIHGANSLLMSANILDNIKKMYSEIMDFNEVNGAAHHVPLDKPLEIVDIIKSRLF